MQSRLHRHLLFLLLLPLLFFTFPLHAQTPPLLKQGNARVVLVGDSITGLSRNASAGFAHLMDKALLQTYPGCKPNIIALGGSGQGVNSWSGVEKRSRTEELFLDVKGIPVKATLDQHADVLVIMLGMNDVLAPYVLDEPASLQKWTDTYRDLIKSLQSRLTPGITALATPTLCTEDINSPKNRMMDQLIVRVTALAAEMKLPVLPTNASMREVLKKGRALKPDFHVTYDFVHPNEPGQLAIAMGMLRGLGEDEAARHLEEERLAKVLQKAAMSPTAPLVRIPLELPLLQWRQDNRWSGGHVISEMEMSLPWSNEDWWRELPLGWPFIQENFTGIPTAVEFPVTADFRPARDFFDFLLFTRNRAAGEGHHMSVPTLWLVAAGLMRDKAWKNNQTFDPALAHGPVEKAIEQNRILDDAICLPGDQPLKWQIYNATVNFTGGDNPGSVDFAAITHARTLEGGVAARRVWSKRQRTVHLDLGTQAFAGIMHLSVYLNGRPVYSGLITAEPKKHKTIEVTLHQGWNILAFTLDHVAWQVQCSVDLSPVEGDSLDDLLYSVAPKNLPLDQ